MMARESKAQDFYVEGKYQPEGPRNLVYSDFRIGYKSPV